MLCESNKYCNMTKMACSLSLDSSRTRLFIKLYVDDTVFYDKVCFWGIWLFKYGKWTFGLNAVRKDICFVSLCVQAGPRCCGLSRSPNTSPNLHETGSHISRTPTRTPPTSRWCSHTYWLANTLIRLVWIEIDGVMWLLDENHAAARMDILVFRCGSVLSTCSVVHDVPLDCTAVITTENVCLIAPQADR